MGGQNGKELHFNKEFEHRTFRQIIPNPYSCFQVSLDRLGHWVCSTLMTLSRIEPSCTCIRIPTQFLSREVTTHRLRRYYSSFMIIESHGIFFIQCQFFFKISQAGANLGCFGFNLFSLPKAVPETTWLLRPP